jgi:alkanesulfonate monooxygenase SsuD/methylene tetrahydromethanopterin reductase-like flavin-dependent oxidoreductase (luciferase family)
VPYSERGHKFEEMLAEIERVWSGHEYGVAGGIGPDVTADPPDLLLGGSVDVAFKRAARYGVGWILGGGTPDAFADAGCDELLMFPCFADPNQVELLGEAAPTGGSGSAKRGRR